MKKKKKIGVKTILTVSHLIASRLIVSHTRRMWKWRMKHVSRREMVNFVKKKNSLCRAHPVGVSKCSRRYEKRRKGAEEAREGERRMEIYRDREKVRKMLGILSCHFSLCFFTTACILQQLTVTHKSLRDPYDPLLLFLHHFSLWLFFFRYKRLTNITGYAFACWYHLALFRLNRGTLRESPIKIVIRTLPA